MKPFHHSGKPHQETLLNKTQKLGVATWISMLLLAPNPSNGQKAEELAQTVELGHYPYESYTSKDYGVFENSSIWQLAQGDSGFIYGASQSGLVCFNGKRWSLIQLPDKTWVTSLINVPGKGILVSSQESFYLYNEQTRSFKTIQWETDDPIFTHQFDFTLDHSGNVHFQKRSNYFCLDWEQQSFVPLEFTTSSTREEPGIYHSDIFFYSTFMLSISPLGVETNVRNPIFWESSPVNHKAVIKHPLDSTTWVGIGSKEANKTLYHYRYNEDSTTIEVVEQFKLAVPMHQIVSMHSDHQNRLVITTKFDGMWIMDDRGHAIHHISNDNYPVSFGNFNHSILDHQGGLWVAHKNGITHIDIRSPITYFADDPRQAIFIDDVLYRENTVWFGTHNGIQKMKWNADDWKIQTEAFAIAQSPHWNVEAIGDEIWTVVDNEGTYQLSADNNSNGIRLVPGAPKELEFLKEKSRFYITSFLGRIKIGHIPTTGESPEIVAKSKLLNKSIYKTDLGHNEVLWLTAVSGKLYYIPTKTITDLPGQMLPEPTEMNGLPQGTRVYLEVGKTETIAAINEQLFEIDETTFIPRLLQFSRPQKLNKKSFGYQFLKHIEGQKYAVTVNTEGRLDYWVLDLDSEGEDTRTFQQLKLLDGFSTTVAEKDAFGNLWYFGANGAAKVDLREKAYSPPMPELSFDRIQIADQTFTPGYQTKSIQLNPLPSTAKKLTVSVNFPSFIQKQEKQISHKFTFTLTGKTNSQFISGNGSLEIPNFTPGNYQLQVTATDALERTTTPITLEFRILPPWYLSKIAIVLYALIVIALMFFITKWRLEVQKDKLWLERLESERKLQLESAAKDAQLQALRMQINPHFLFNSLNFISQSLTEQPTIKESVDRLAQFLKHALDERSSRLVSFASEIEAIQQYLQIEEAKQERQMKIDYHLAPETMELLVPGLLIQPIVENALKYGQPDESGTMRISVFAKMEAHTFVITLQNSGQWKDTQSGRVRPPLGMKNVEKRLKLQYGDRATLMIQNLTETKRVEIKLQIPLETA